MIVDNNIAGTRLDFALSLHTQCKNLGTRARKRLCDNGQVFVNGRSAKASYKLLLGQKIEIIDFQKEDNISKIEDLILKEDENFIALYKASGIASAKIVVGNNNSIEEQVHAKNPHYILLNRLDKETSGILICAKNDEAHILWKEAQENGKIEKRYYALVEGEYTEDICIDSQISVKRNKVRSIEKLEEDENRYTWASPITEAQKSIFKDILKENTSIVDCMIKKGHRHQIRCHLASIGFPLAGDSLYALQDLRYSEEIQEVELKTKENTFFLHHYAVKAELFSVECSLERRLDQNLRLL